MELQVPVQMRLQHRLSTYSLRWCSVAEDSWQADRMPVQSLLQSPRLASSYVAPSKESLVNLDYIILRPSAFQIECRP